MRAVVNAMPDQLTRDGAVFLFLDHQVGPLWEPDATALRRDAARLAAAAKRLGVPTVLSAMSCDAWGPIVPELREASRGAPTVRRATINAWHVQRVRQAIEATGRTHLIVAGLAIEGCVLATALAAAESGYHVHLVLDASGHFRREDATAAIARLLRAGVTVTTSSALLVQLGKGLDSQATEILALAVCHSLPSPPATAPIPMRTTGDAA